MKKSLITLHYLFLSTFFFGIVAQENISIGQAEITFEKSVHDYGVIDQFSNGECEFVFTNTGTAPLLISQARGTCGCTIPEWPREPIQPGASSSIIVRYDTKRIGEIDKGVTITCNTSPSITTLRIIGEVKELENNGPYKP